MSSNGIAQLPTRQDRQDAKLALAATKRQADGRRSVLDKTQLPNPYNGNEVNPDENPNTNGLIQGRPWV